MRSPVPRLERLAIEVVGEHRVLDLKTSRRITLGAAETNVTALLLRFNAVPDASSAETRWMIRAAPSNEQDKNWGMPRFDVGLVRNRHGRMGRWVMEWNCDDAIFRAREAADRGAVVSAPFDRPAAAAMETKGGAPSPDAPPLVVAAKEKNALVVSALDRKATALGLRVGQPLANARAMLPALKAVTANEPADLKLLGRIADWCERFTPFVALDPPRGLLLDVTGVTHLFGGEQAMLGRICANLEGQGFAVRGGMAGSALAARALARYRSGSVAAPGDEAKAIAGLPVEALLLDPITTHAFRRAGLKRVDQVAGRDRRELTSRFGARMVFTLDAALGAAEAPILPRTPLPDYRARTEFSRTGHDRRRHPRGTHGTGFFLVRKS